MSAHVEVKGETMQDVSSPKKKFKLSKKKMLIVGGIGVVLLVLLMALRRGATTSQEAGGNYTVGTGGLPAGGVAGGDYGSNSVDMQAQLQQMKDSLSQEVQSQFGKYASELQQNNNDLASGMSGVVGDMASQYKAEMDAQMGKFATMNQANEDALSMLQQQLYDQNARFSEQLSIFENGYSNSNDPYKGVTSKPSVYAERGEALQESITSQRNVALLKTGTFKSKADADKIASILNKDYGGTDTKVFMDGDKWRVTSAMGTSERVDKVANRLKELKLVNTTYNIWGTGSPTTPIASTRSLTSITQKQAVTPVVKPAVKPVAKVASTTPIAPKKVTTTVAPKTTSPTVIKPIAKPVVKKVVTPVKTTPTKATATKSVVNALKKK